MANHPSAIKRIREDKERKNHNSYYAKTMRHAIRNFRNITTKKEAEEQLPGLIALIDKNAKRSVIHKNKAANLKSKLTKHLSTLS